MWWAVGWKRKAKEIILHKNFIKHFLLFCSFKIKYYYFPTDFSISFFVLKTTKTNVNRIQLTKYMPHLYKFFSFDTYKVNILYCTRSTLYDCQYTITIIVPTYMVMDYSSSIYTNSTWHLVR